MSVRALTLFAGWQLRDAAPKAVLAPLAIFALVPGFPLAMMIAEYSLAGLRTPGDAQAGAMAAYQNFLPFSLALGAIVLVSGGASLDRERQFVRFLFSRPVAPWAYYLQQFVLSTAIFVATVTLFPLLFGWLVTDVPVVPVVKVAALYALAYGSLALFCGALLNRDGLFFIGVIAVAQMFTAADDAGALNTVFSYFAKALPPLFSVGQIRAAWFAGNPADAGDLQHVIGYASAMLVAALWIIHRRPLVR